MADGTSGVSARPRSHHSQGSESEDVGDDDRGLQTRSTRRESKSTTPSSAEAARRADAHYTNGDTGSAKASRVDAGSCGRGGGNFGQSVDVSNRSEVTRLLKRLDALNASPNASPAEHAWLRSIEPSLRTAQKRFVESDRAQVEAQARLAAVVHPERRFTDLKALSVEIFRLKAEASKREPAAHEPAIAQALKQQLTMLQSQWVEMAKAANIPEPSGRLDPLTAKPEEVARALMWSEAGGVIPRHELAADGGRAFQTSIRDAIILRTQGFDALLDSHRAEPEVQKAFLYRDLARLGHGAGVTSSPSPSASDTVESLRARRQEIVTAKEAEKTREEMNAARRQLYIGVDGFVGNAESVAIHDRNEMLSAANPGTTAGSILATYLGGDDFDKMKAWGEAGNTLEGVAGGAGTVVQQNRDAREAAAGGVGKRTLDAPPPKLTATSGRPSSAASSVALDRRHVLTGEVKSRDQKRARAVGFHHEGPNAEATSRLVAFSETKPDRFGVYEARVMMKNPQTGGWVAKSARSTFFPKSWTEDEVCAAIREAHANGTLVKENEWVGKLPNGMTIRGYTDKAGNITSAFPEMEKEE